MRTRMQTRVRRSAWMAGIEWVGDRREEGGGKGGLVEWGIAATALIEGREGLVGVVLP